MTKSKDSCATLDPATKTNNPPQGAWIITRFGDGASMVWEPRGKVPKLNELARECVVYLFRSVDEAKSNNLVDPYGFKENEKTGEAWAASGCLVHFDSEHTFHSYVVTNRHVVKSGCVVPRFSFKDPGTADHDYILDAVEDDWYCNLLDTDLAILPVTDETVKSSVYGIGAYAFDRNMTGLDINVGDDVAMLGRFFPVSGGSRNRAVARFGNISTWPTTKVTLRWMSPSPEKTYDVILAEMRSHSGYSGSPVFVFEGLKRNLNRLLDVKPIIPKERVDIDRPDLCFLGIDYGHLEGNTAIIIPWFKVGELLETKTLVQLRKRHEGLFHPTIPD